MHDDDNNAQGTAQQHRRRSWFDQITTSGFLGDCCDFERAWHQEDGEFVENLSNG